MIPDQPEPRFEYFMLRVSRSEQDPNHFEGQIERLGSGVKHKFDSGDQLLRLVAGCQPTFNSERRFP